MELVLNLVHYPRHFSIQVLPEAVKAALERRLRSEILDDPDTPPSIAMAVREVLSFLEGARPEDEESWHRCVDTIRERDGIRGEHFVRAFPELVAELDRAGAWPHGTSVELS